MEKIKLTFLGTGSAVPTKKHNHPALLINYKDENILIDCGEGTQRQFRYADLSAAKITRLLITHWHGDHILGIPGLMQTLAMNDYSKKLHVYGPKGTKRYMSEIMNIFAFIGKIDMEIHEVDNETVFETKDFQIKSERLSHGTECLAYSFIEKAKTRLDKKKLKKFKLPNSPLLGELQQGKDIIFNGKKIKASDVCYKQESRKVTIILDTGLCDSAIRTAKDADILVCESSYLESDKDIAEDRNHLTAKQAATIAKKAKAKSLYLVHLSQRYEGIPKVIEKEAKSIFKSTTIANDLDVVEI
jgi:ribonuclease Z